MKCRTKSELSFRENSDRLTPDKLCVQKVSDLLTLKVPITDE